MHELEWNLCCLSIDSGGRTVKPAEKPVWSPLPSARHLRTTWLPGEVSMFVRGEGAPQVFLITWVAYLGKRATANISTALNCSHL
ncbi:hypothetical protein V2G26_003231 [Clonostachys chloroleuca]